MTAERRSELLDRCEDGHIVQVILAKEKDPIVRKGLRAAMRYQFAIIVICTICAIMMINMWIMRSMQIEFFNIELHLPLRLFAIVLIVLAIIAERILKNKLRTEIIYLRIEADDIAA